MLDSLDSGPDVLVENKHMVCEHIAEYFSISVSQVTLSFLCCYYYVIRLDV